MRYERKYCFKQSDYFSLVSHLTSNGFAIKYPKRVVSSVYFDTLDFRLFTLSQAGIKNRSKKRFRWYSNQIMPKFENKIKQDETSFKDDYITNLDNEDDISVNYLCPLSKLNYDIVIPKKINQIYFPNISIAYERDYFLSNCGGLRVTLDTNINFSPIHFVGDHSKISCWMPYSKSILELKYDLKFRGCSEAISSILDNLKLCLSKNSKYCQGILQLNN